MLIIIIQFFIPLAAETESLPPGDDGHEHDISPEEEAELLASDNEDMEVEPKDDDRRQAAASESSFCSAKSSVGDPASPKPHQLPLSRAHSAIRAARLALMSGRSLNTGITAPLLPVGSLAEMGDDRPNRAFMVHSFATNRNICASFDTATLICLTCNFKPEHKVLSSNKDAGPSKYDCPSVFVLSDQSFPACIPTGGEGECLKIIRLEDGSLPDLVNIFLESVKKFVVPAGSIILLHSISHLAWAGPAAYCEDFVRARQKILAVYRSGLSVIGGLPLLANGCTDKNIVQDLATVSIWLETVRHPAERDITATRALWRSLFTPVVSKPSAETTDTVYCGKPSAPKNLYNIGSGSKPSALPVSVAVRPSASADLEGVRPSASPSVAVRPWASADLEGARPSASPSHNPDPCLQPSAWLNCSPMAQGPSVTTSYTQKLRLPASLDSQRTSIFSLDGPLNLIMEAATESTERTIIECLIRELNLKFNAGLDNNFSTSRSGEPTISEDIRETFDFVMVGSSHAHRISAALSAGSERVLCLTSPSWRLNAENVAALIKPLEEAVSNNPGAVVVFQLYDSSIYFGSTDSGELSLPKRGEDGRYHVLGELALAEWSTLRKIFNISVPLLRAAGTNKKLILSPLPRYVQGKCCDDRQHITNFGTSGYATEMGTSLAQIYSWLGDLAHGKRIVDGEIVCVSTSVGLEGNPSKRDLAKLWGSDPVHLTPAGYQKMADKIVEMAEAHRTKLQLLAPGPAKSSQAKKEERRPGLSSSDLTAGRWDSNLQTSRAGGSGTSVQSSGKRRYSGGSKSSKRRI